MEGSQVCHCWRLQFILGNVRLRVEAQRKRQHRQVALSIDEVWERFQGQGGLHQIEALSSALLKEGCEDDTVDRAKDAYLAGLISNDNPEEVRRALALHLTQALHSFTEEQTEAARQGAAHTAPLPPAPPSVASGVATTAAAVDIDSVPDEERRALLAKLLPYMQEPGVLDLTFASPLGSPP